MDFGLWLTFVSVCFVLSVIPGPSVLVVTAQAISNGSRAALICILGELFGGVCLMILALLGVGQIVATSPLLFQAIRWAGVVYLVYIGLKAILESRHIANGAADSPLPNGSFKAGFWTSLFNPKSLVFYLAFLTQFVDVKAPLAAQYMILIVTAATVAAIVLSVYALFATTLRRFLSVAESRRKFSQLSGLFYIAGGALVAITR